MIVATESLRQVLVTVNDEISAAIPLSFESYQAGLVLFQPRRKKEESWITHGNAEVVSYVLEGNGRLRLPEANHRVAPGMICRIPVNTAHDFVAEGEEPLLMFCVTVKVGSHHQDTEEI
mgnify:CR=1 FL=1